MSRPWSRFGVRALAVSLLSVGVAGGYYLGEDREIQQQGVSAQRAVANERVELEYMHARHAAYLRATAARRAAEEDAAAKAAEAAREAAERARRANEEVTRKEREAAAEKARKEAETKTAPYPIPASCSEYSGNRATGCAVLLDSGFGLDQMPCLDKLWTKESGWNHKASNPSSGAYGIPQALPGSKMGSVADDWRTNPATQIKWGLGYIEDRYGTPCNAWSHSQSTGWY